MQCGAPLAQERLQLDTRLYQRRGSNVCGGYVPSGRHQLPRAVKRSQELADHRDQPQPIHLPLELLDERRAAGLLPRQARALSGVNSFRISALEAGWLCGLQIRDTADCKSGFFAVSAETPISLRIPLRMKIGIAGVIASLSPTAG